jgi:TolB protein
MMRLIFLCCLMLTIGMGIGHAQDTGALPDIEGYIAYIGTDYNVYLLNGPEKRVTQLTEDGSTERRQARSYQWPTWAIDGRLAYFGTQYNSSAQPLGTDVYVIQNTESEGELVYEGNSEIFNYAYWSPQNCQDSGDCRDLAVLLSSQSAGGLFVEIIRDEPGGTTSVTTDTGSPFYFSWSPDGKQMLWQRNNLRLDIYDIMQGEITRTLSEAPGSFFAPAWSPIDDRWLLGIESSQPGRTDLVIVAGNDVQTLVSGLEGVLTFAWSPDGNYVAYSNRQGALVVLDAITGDTVAVAPVGDLIAFFWSPNSKSLAYVGLGTTNNNFSASAIDEAQAVTFIQEQSGLSWSVLDIQSGSTQRYNTFMPTSDMIYLLRFFDQFAQSHRVWSPDSRYLLYSEVTTDNRSVITLLDVTQENSIPLSIAEGFIGVWSFE